MSAGGLGFLMKKSKKGTAPNEDESPFSTSTLLIFEDPLHLPKHDRLAVKAVAVPEERSYTTPSSKDGSKIGRSAFKAADLLNMAGFNFISKRFDPEYYLREYPDIDPEKIDPLRHFMDVGWFEGRNPNAFFDTVSYFLKYPDVDRAGINPYFHYIVHGITEGRQATSSVGPSSRTRLLFGYAVTDWVSKLSPHVDLDFYLGQFERPPLAGANMAAHYAYRGWREGKKPSLEFDEIWSIENPGISRYLVNPILIRDEVKRGTFDPALIEIDLHKALSEKPVELQPKKVEELSDANVTEFKPLLELDTASQIRLMELEFDRTFYALTCPDVVAAGLDPLEHYFYTGWREGRNPNDQFDTSHYIRISPEIGAEGPNPFFHFLAIGKSQGRSPLPPRQASLQEGIEVKANTPSELSTIKSEFESDYYLAAYPDVAEANVDPLIHYFYTGWKEGRNPNDQFDTLYYLATNFDVKEAGLNPFWHYLVSGRAEGRLPHRPGGYKRIILDSAMPPSLRQPSNPDPEETERSSEELAPLLNGLRKGARGIAVSLSHDCYINVIGGTQIFISDEERRFNAENLTYLHISPQLARLNLAPKTSKFLVRIVANGIYLGLFHIKALSDYLRLDNKQRQIKIFVIHCALGFHVPEIVELWREFRPKHSAYWLHDYSSLCEGFNLLRNDVEFCNAPPVDSVACRVCVYGETRRLHIGELSKLFESCSFEVLSPSKVALDLWITSTSLPYRSARVHPHWKVIKEPVKNASPAAEGTVSVAFLGFPSNNKGWPIFAEIVRSLGDDPRYRFFHFAARNAATLSKVEFVPTEVTSSDRQAALSALRGNSIQVLLLLSPWPETFSFAAHEAVAAGVMVFCLIDSGNVASLVEREKVGKVFVKAQDIIDFLKEESAPAFVKEKIAKMHCYKIENSGTTATALAVLKAK